MDKANIALSMAESALEWAVEHYTEGNQSVRELAMLRLSTSMTPLPWLVMDANGLIESGHAKLPANASARNRHIPDYAARRYKVYEDVSDGAVSIGTISGDGAIRDLRGSQIFAIAGDQIFDMKGNLYGLIHTQGEHAVVYDVQSPRHLKLLLVRSDLL